MRRRCFLILIICVILLPDKVIVAQSSLYKNAFSLNDVTLLDGPFKKARDLNLQVILQYDVDRLLAPYQKEAGLKPGGLSYPNWDGLDGHVGGHYLSALAINYAATKNAECKKKMVYMINVLNECQEAHTKHHAEWGDGYVGGVPNSKEIWSSLKTGEFKAYRDAWVPWYNVHKMYAGLRDAWIYAGNEDARRIFLKFCDWGISVTANLNEEQMQSMLDTEHGGMNEIFADAYQISGDAKYLIAAKRFSHKAFLEPLSSGVDNLDNKHANTQVPKAIGFQRIAELSQDKKYSDAGRFFWETVTKKRSLAFGGNSRREFFPGIAACGDFVNDVEGPETCNSYNMLKLTEDLFRVHPSAEYADYYERTLYNHILSTQHPINGGYVYFTPTRPRHYRVYSKPNEAMWCCVGSGMENHSKYNQFIYAHQHDSLYLNLFVASALNWQEKGIKIQQETTFPYEEQTRLKVTEGTSQFTWMIRYPFWVKEGMLKIRVNEKEILYTAKPSSYIAINRTWKKGDVIEITLPMHNRIEHLPNLPNYIAILHGPILLAARTGTEDLKGLISDDSRWGHIASGERLPIDKAPIILEDNLLDLANKLEPVAGKPLTFTASRITTINTSNIILEPFYKIHDSRYMIYWMALSGSQYQTYLDSLGALEREKLALQKQTIDFVAAGEQQPEADHAMQSDQSQSGSMHNEFWRDASNGGYFSYQLATSNETGLSLMVRYWGAEWGNRKFDIYIDEERLVQEDNTGRWNQSMFMDVIYNIPDSMIQGRKHIRIKFQSLPQNSAGAVYYLRLLKKPISKKISPDLFGLFFEDINYAADGGLYAELVQNRSFEYSPTSKSEWHSFSSWEYITPGFSYGSLNVETASPIHPNNPHYVVMNVEHVGQEEKHTGPSGVGIKNTGYDGMAIRAGNKYNFSMFARQLSNEPITLMVGLQTPSGKILAEEKITISSNEWKKYTTSLTSTISHDTVALVVMATTKGKLALDVISLFPEHTFENRTNGLRPDLVQALADMKPGFIRFPGGCLVHGDGLGNMYRWKNTIGPIEQRVEQKNLWGYHQTAGLGYYEYFQLCEDIGAKPLPVLPAAVSCQNSGGTWRIGGTGQRALLLDEMAAYIQEVLDLIEWANGPVTSVWGAKRAAAGHAAPFNLQYVCIGNEEKITPEFEERFKMIFDAVKKKHPEITVIGTSGPFPDGDDFTKGWAYADQHAIPVIDEHYYKDPNWMIQHLNRYDSYDRSKSKVYLGEYASWGNKVINAISEAAYMVGLERNGDVVSMASYAPLFAKKNHTQWKTNMIFFDNNQLCLTPNYHVQRMFSVHRGDVYFDKVITKDNNDSTLAASCVQNSKTGDIILKLVNAGKQAKIMQVDLTGFGSIISSAEQEVLAGDADAENTLEMPNKVVPVKSLFKANNQFHYETLPMSLTVIHIKTKP